MSEITLTPTLSRSTGRGGKSLLLRDLRQLRGHALALVAGAVHGGDDHAFDVAVTGVVADDNLGRVARQHLHFPEVAVLGVDRVLPDLLGLRGRVPRHFHARGKLEARVGAAGRRRGCGGRLRGGGNRKIVLARRLDVARRGRRLVVEPRRGGDERRLAVRSVLQRVGDAVAVLRDRLHAEVHVAAGAG